LSLHGGNTRSGNGQVVVQLYASENRRCADLCPVDVVLKGLGQSIERQDHKAGCELMALFGAPFWFTRHWFSTTSPCVGGTIHLRRAVLWWSNRFACFVLAESRRSEDSNRARGCHLSACSAQATLSIEELAMRVCQCSCASASGSKSTSSRLRNNDCWTVETPFSASVRERVRSWKRAKQSSSDRS
jgi:hypothetical protein